MDQVEIFDKNVQEYEAWNFQKRAMAKVLLWL